MFESLSSNEQEVVLSYTLDNKRGVFRLCNVTKNPNLRIKTDPLSVGADATIYFWFLCIFVMLICLAQKPHTVYTVASALSAKIQSIFGDSVTKQKKR